MAAELLGAKMLAPFFGSSLYVWTTTLSMTLGALTSGYFVGGRLSPSPQRLRWLVFVLFLAALFISLMPFSVRYSLNILPETSLIGGILLSGGLSIFPPIFCLGVVSPLIIGELSYQNQTPGRVAGNIYAFSTLGGILFTLVYGFWAIPYFGLTGMALFTGGILATFSAVFFFRVRGTFALVIAGWIGFSVLPDPSLGKIETDQKNRQLNVLSLQEGLLGQVMVTERLDPSGTMPNARYLMVNRVIQTEYFPFKKESSSLYSHIIEKIANNLKNRDNALVLGLGGGRLSSLLISKVGFKSVQACELDSRIYEAARQFFDLDKRIHVIIDDARHFLNQLSKSYNLIVFDLFRGEESPEHVITLESLRELKKNLSPDALLIINSHGYFRGGMGAGNQAIYKTLVKAGYSVDVYATSIQEENSNNLFVCALKSPSIIKLRPIIQGRLIASNSFDLNKAILLQDNYPVLNYLNMDAAKAWRKAYIQIQPYYESQKIPFFY